MKVTIESAPWTNQEPSREIMEAAEVLGRNVWRDAAVRFHVVKKDKKKLGVRAPKGIQPYLNEVIDARFLEAGWTGGDGGFRKRDTWIRVTFRHQMSLGSDFLEAFRLVKKEGVRQAAIFAATHAFLKLVTPNEASTVISYEKVMAKCSNLTGLLDIPIFVGKLEPRSELPPEVEEDLKRPRPRDLLLRPTSESSLKPAKRLGDS